MRSGATVTEDRSRATCEHCCQPLPLGTHALVPDRIDPPVDAVQPSGLYSACDRTAAEAGFHELSPADNPVLFACLGRDLPVGMPPRLAFDAFCTHQMHKASSVRISPLA